jgi:hypothetical protein
VCGKSLAGLTSCKCTKSVALIGSKIKPQANNELAMVASYRVFLQMNPNILMVLTGEQTHLETTLSDEIVP